MPEFVCEHKQLNLPIYRAYYPVDDNSAGFFIGKTGWKLRKIMKKTGVKITRPTKDNHNFTIYGVTYSAVERAWIMFFDEGLKLIRVQSDTILEKFLVHTLTLVVEAKDNEEMESLTDKIRSDYIMGTSYENVNGLWSSQLSKVRRGILGDAKSKPFYWLTMIHHNDCNKTINQVVNYLLNTPFTETIQSTWKASFTPSWMFSPDDKCSFSELRQKYKIEPFCSYSINIQRQVGIYSSDFTVIKSLEEVEANFDQLCEMADELHFYDLRRFIGSPVSSVEDDGDRPDNEPPAGKIEGSNRPPPLPKWVVND